MHWCWQPRYRFMVYLMPNHGSGRLAEESKVLAVISRIIRRKLRPVRLWQFFHFEQYLHHANLRSSGNRLTADGAPDLPRYFHAPVGLNRSLRFADDAPHLLLRLSSLHLIAHVDPDRSINHWNEEDYARAFVAYVMA